MPFLAGECSFHSRRSTESLRPPPKEGFFLGLLKRDFTQVDGNLNQHPVSPEVQRQPTSLLDPSCLANHQIAGRGAQEAVGEVELLPFVIFSTAALQLLTEGKERSHQRSCAALSDSSWRALLEDRRRARSSESECQIPAVGDGPASGDASYHRQWLFIRWWWNWPPELFLQLVDIGVRLKTPDGYRPREPGGSSQGPTFAIEKNLIECHILIGFEALRK